MNVRKSDDFISDIEQQFEWYAINANWEVADAYLTAVEATCRLIGQHPQIGPIAGLTHPRLDQWRFFVVFHPFNKHVLFYEIIQDDVVLRRAMHGVQDLRKALEEPPQL